jgi:hypothetical protein
MDLQELADALRAGTISIGEWEAGMRDYLREQYRVAVELGTGGNRSITQSDWGYEGSLLKKQYQFLNKFAQDIKDNPQKYITGNGLKYRMDLYKESAYTALANFQEREAKLQGFNEESNELGDAEHCGGCLEQPRYPSEWVAIGEIIPVGSRDCIIRCKCTIRYRRLEVDGTYTEG